MLSANEPYLNLEAIPAPLANFEEKSRVSKKEDKRVIEHLEALVASGLNFTRLLDLDKVLQLIADTAREFIHSTYAALAIVDEQGVITSFITSGLSDQEREKIGELPHGHGLLGVLIHQSQPLRVGDMSTDPRRSGFPANHPKMTSLLGVPVSVQGRVVGDLYLSDKIGSKEFSLDDQWWATRFARQAAVAVENANLYKKAQLAQQRAQTLTELISALNHSIEPEELFEQITRASSQLLELPAAALYLLDSQSPQFVLQAQIGLQLEPGEPSSLPLEGSIAGRVLEQGGTITVADTGLLPEIFFLPMPNGVLPRGLLAVPIRPHQQIIGVIEGYSAQPRHFSLEEVGLLEAFAAQAALTLEKAQLYKQKEEFLSMMAHDLRAPLTAIKLSSGLLQAHLPPDLPELLSRLVNNINHNSERLNNLVDDLLDLMRLEQGQMRLITETVEIGQLIVEALNNLLPLFEEKKQTLNFERPQLEYYAEVDRHRFEQVLVNIVANAHKYTPEGGVIRVELEATNQQLVLAIEDSGPGIPPEEQRRIFERYYRRALHEQARGTGGSGLGLTIARYLIELHKGKLWVESEVGQGSTFFIQLPLTQTLAC